MPIPRHPLRINVGFLLSQPIGTSRDIDFEYPQVRLGEDFDLTNLKGFTRIGRTPQGLVVQGEFSAVVKAECVRCLSEYDQSLQTSFDELYAFSQRTASESGLILPEDANIDFEPLVREYLILEIPISPVCKPDCKGLCPMCGENLNEQTCEHEQQDVA